MTISTTQNEHEITVELDEQSARQLVNAFETGDSDLAEWFKPFHLQNVDIASADETPEGNAMNSVKSLQIFVGIDDESSCREEAEYLFDRMKEHFEKEEKRRKKTKKSPVEQQPFKMGGATGRTQLGVYRRLFELYDEQRSASESERGEGRVDLSNVEIYFLDEYFGAAPLYYSYARQHLRVGKGGFHADNVWVPRGCFFAPVATGGKLVNSDMLDEILKQTKGEWEARFEVGEDDERKEKPQIFIRPDASHPVLKKIRRSNRAYHDRVCTQGKGRIALLGLGTHGHIGFVECGAAPTLSDPEDKDSKLKGASEVMLVRLSARTQSDNEADFLLTNGDDNRVDLEESRYAITQGIETIMSAGELLLAAHGEKKAPAVKRMLLGNPGPQNPAAFIQRHKQVRVYLDVAAFGDLQPEELEERGYEVRLSEKVQQLRETAPETA